MANSPALLEGYRAFSGALAKGRLRPAVREQIALTVSQSNGCNYCLSAHSYFADRVAHLEAATIASARLAESTDPKISAILRLAGAINDTRGSLGAEQLQDARAAGLNDDEIAETIANVALNVLTN
jgi:AhpD family alkylhydroperoxidase